MPHIRYWVIQIPVNPYHILEVVDSSKLLTFNSKKYQYINSLFPPTYHFSDVFVLAVLYSSNDNVNSSFWVTVTVSFEASAANSSLVTSKGDSLGGFRAFPAAPFFQTRCRRTPDAGSLVAIPSVQNGLLTADGSSDRFVNEVCSYVI